MSEHRIFLERAPWGRGISLHIARETSQRGKVALMEPVQFRVVDEDETAIQSPPALQLSITDAQRLIDELWHCGIRPTEGTGSAGSLAATERHLKDMQRLVFERPVAPGNP